MQRPLLVPQLPQPDWGEAPGLHPGGADSAGEALRAARARSAHSIRFPRI